MNEQPIKFTSRVIDLKHISTSGYELTLERGDLTCEAGRLVLLHGQDATEDRSYTLCSGEHDEHIQVLFRHIPTGKLTPQLITLTKGDTIDVSGPYGEFTVRDPKRPVFFIATGTGIAPCRSYARTHKDLNLTIVHGCRVAEDLFYHDEFEAQHTYYPCVSRESGVGFHGRVTDFVKDYEFEPGTQFYLCGANEMIFDIQMLLTERGVDSEDVFTEAYYYRLHS